jgi:hypothetical protein
MDHSPAELHFPFVSGKAVITRFDGGNITSDAGMLLLAQADRKLGLCQALAESILDARDPSKVAHPLLDLLRERVYAIALGYEDANDLDTLAHDPALRVACGRGLTPEDRLASQPTLSRLENAVDSKDLLVMGMRLAALVIAQLPKHTKQVILDVDASEDPCHGQQELELFNGHYNQHCYLPLYVHVTAEDGRQRLLGALLRPGTAEAKCGLFALLRRAIGLLRQHFPKLKITLRADGGFGQAEVLAFCEAEGLPFVLGLPTNRRLKRLAQPYEAQALQRAASQKQPRRYYASFAYQADTWAQSQCVIERIEIADDTVKARFVVSNLIHLDAQEVYEFYCGRGEQENRIKEMKLDLHSGRTSCHRFLANQFRLLLHAAACVLLGLLQESLVGTSLAQAQIATLRLKLLKVGAQAKQSVRAVWFHVSSAFPHQALWSWLYARLCVT